MSKRIYLSPSNQPSNMYANRTTNEKVEMEAVAKAVEFYLKRYVVEVVMATLSLPFPQRDEEAIAKGCTDYLAIHSNAGGGGTGVGTVAFYHPDQPVTKILAQNLVRELDAICPYAENRSQQVQNGMLPFDGYGLGEIREPKKKGMNAVLLEVNFHDNLKVANWIVQSKDAIAQGIVRALVIAYDLKLKAVEPATPLNAGYAVVTASTLNIRDGRSVNSNIIGKLTKGMQVKLMYLSEGWWSIDVPLSVSQLGYGFVSADWLSTSIKPVEVKPVVAKAQYGTVVARPYLNVRDKANGKKIGQLENGQVVVIMGTLGDWYKVSWGINQGWVAKAYVRLK